MSAQSNIFNPSQTTSAASGDGFSVPRLTTAGRLAITFTTADKGMMVYDTTLNNLFIWNGSAWESVPASGDAGANGSVQYNDNGVVSGAVNFVWDKATSSAGIGTATPNDKLEVVGSGGSGIRVSRSGVSTQYTTLSAGATGPSLDASSAIGALTFGVAGSTKMTVDTSGNVGIANGNLVMSTSGKGIDFSATPETPGATSELFSDYEEGTFTATLRGQVEPATKLSSTGRYTKIGRKVTIDFVISGDTTGYGGVIYVTGLPYQSVAGVPESYGAAVASFIDLIGYTAMVSFVPSGDVVTYFIAYKTVSANTYAQHNPGAGRNFCVTITYTAA